MSASHKQLDRLSRKSEAKGAPNAKSITTPLYIAGQARFTTDAMPITDPAKPGVIVGHAAAATLQDVNDAVDAARKAYPRLGCLERRGAGGKNACGP